MNHRKLYIHGLTEAELFAVAGQLALSNVGVTMCDAYHTVISAQYDETLVEVVERCQRCVGRPLEVGMNHRHAGTHR